VMAFKGGSRSRSGARTGLGKDFAELVDYLCRGSRGRLDPDRVAWISYRNLDGVAEPEHAAQIMRACSSQHPHTGKPVYHFGLSLPPSDHLDREQWNRAVDQVLERLGLGGHQALVVAHRDTAHEHLHIVVNRVGDDGRAWPPGYDIPKVLAAVRHIEIELGLTRDVDRERPIPELASIACRHAVGIDQEPLVERVRAQAAADFAEAASWSDLETRLAAHGFRLRVATRHPGLLVTDGSHFAALSRLDRAISGPKLAQRFGETFDDHRRAHPEPPAVLDPGPEASRRPGDNLESRAAALLDRLTQTRATFSEADLRHAASYQPESMSLVRAALRSDGVLDLGTDAGGAVRYTTREYLDAEARLLAAAAALASRDRFRLEPADLAASATAAGEPATTGLQRAAVHHATAGADLAQIVGGDRDGRAVAAGAIATAYRERGYEAQGAALTAHAAAALESATGIRSRTLAGLERAWSKGAGLLHERSVLFVDEAGTLDVRRLGGVLAEAEARGAKVVLLGDPGRLQAIGAGDAFRGLLEQHPSVRLDALQRQLEPWQAAASEQLAAGRVAATLDRYEAAGHLHWTASRGEARAELLGAHARDRLQDPGGTRLILAPDRTEAALLNAAVRAERRAAGELGPGIRAGGAELAVGDRIVFRRDDRQGSAVVNLDASPVLGVHRGSLGTVVRAERHRLEVRLDDGRRVAFDPAHYRSVGHGYAVTIGESRAAAADRVYVLADPRMDRDAAVVALTRHRGTLDVYADRDTFPSRERLDRALSRPGQKDLASDYAAADLRRAIGRLQDHAAAIARATCEERPLREALAAHEALRQARLRVVEARRSLSQPAGQVYAEPARALRGLLGDPAAADRLREGAARHYGDLRGRAGFGKAGRERTQALHSVASLSDRLGAYRYSLADLKAAKQQARASLQRIAGPGLAPQPAATVPRGLPDLAARGLPGAAARGLPSAATRGLPGATATPKLAASPPGLPRPAQLRRELARVVADLSGLRQASRGAQDAVETAIRTLGRAAVDSALLLLPRQVALPVSLAVRAVEHVLERTLSLGLGR
jgi:Ti-type conjugative transfer relaxase TraA